jgi:hypothetical protein
LDSVGVPGLRKATLQFLHRESDELRADIGLLQAGQREVVEIISASRRNITVRYAEHLLERLGRFEEMIAAYEARLG